eukprot:2095064-Ditylum_brightwellii.AAC.1
MGTTVSGKHKMLPKSTVAPMLVQKKAVWELHLLLPQKLLFNKKRGRLLFNDFYAIQKSMLLAYIFATSDKKTHCELLFHDNRNKSGKKNCGGQHDHSLC